MRASFGVTHVLVLLFALAEGPQPSPVSHLQNGGGSFNLTSREEFVLLFLISPEVRGNVPWYVGHWLRPGVSRGGLGVAQVGGASELPEGRRNCLGGRGGGGGGGGSPGLVPPPRCFPGLLIPDGVGWRARRSVGSAGLKQGRCKPEAVGQLRSFL